jgi:hypothetical protein
VSRRTAGDRGPGGIGWNVATPASAVTRTVRPGASVTAAVTDLGPIPRTRVTWSRRMRPGPAAGPRPRTTTTGSCLDDQARCRPGSREYVSRDGRSRAASLRARRRTEAPAARCRRADRRAPGLRAPGLRAPGLRAPGRALRVAACRTVLRHTVLRHTALPPTVPRRTGLPPTVLRPAAGPAPEVPAAGPTAGWDPAATSCRTDAGSRRGRNACTGRRGRARRAVPRAGTTGRGPPSRIITRTAGAGRAPPRRGATVRAILVRAGLVHGDRRTGHRHPTGLPARPGSPALRGRLGRLGRPRQPGLRRCASTRPPGRTSRRPTAVTGPARRRSRRVR